METIRVLVVDDEKDFLESLVKRLNLRGFEAYGAGNAQEALSLLESQSVDVAVLDIKMPGMDGLQLLRQLKKSHPQVEGIVLTGHASAETGEQGMDQGAFAYLVKPLPLTELIEQINAAYQHGQNSSNHAGSFSNKPNSPESGN